MKIELSELKKILTRANDINGSLNQELGKMTSALNDITLNVASTELAASNQKIATAVEEISEKVNNNLPKIIDFLSEQISRYETTNESAKTQIDSLVTSVDDTLGI